MAQWPRFCMGDSGAFESNMSQIAAILMDFILTQTELKPKFNTDFFFRLTKTDINFKPMKLSVGYIGFYCFRESSEETELKTKSLRHTGNKRLESLTEKVYLTRLKTISKMDRINSRAESGKQHPLALDHRVSNNTNLFYYQIIFFLLLYTEKGVKQI